MAYAGQWQWHCSLCGAAAARRLRLPWRQHYGEAAAWRLRVGASTKTLWGGCGAVCALQWGRRSAHCGAAAAAAPHWGRYSVHCAIVFVSLTFGPKAYAVHCWAAAAARGLRCSGGGTVAIMRQRRRCSGDGHCGAMVAWRLRCSEAEAVCTVGQLLLTVCFAVRGSTLHNVRRLRRSVYTSVRAPQCTMCATVDASTMPWEEA